MESRESVHYLKFNPRQDGNLLERLIDCYRAVFAGEPWNEWKKCCLCGSKWGIREESKIAVLDFKHCGQPVVDFWHRETVRKDICEEIILEASCWVAVKNSNIIGFCWGYPIELKDLEEKLKLPDFVKRTSMHLNQERYVAYQDEIGVLEEYRRHGIATEMFLRRLKDFQSLGLAVGIIRTLNDESSVPYKWYRKLGYYILDQYKRHDPKDNRVILARSLTDLHIKIQERR